jgi:hypothetical protein
MGQRCALSGRRLNQFAELDFDHGRYLGPKCGEFGGAIREKVSIVRRTLEARLH